MDKCIKKFCIEFFDIPIKGDVSMATVTTPVPPPVKNDWLSSGGENPRLSPPSPGGPRKAAPVQQVFLLPYICRYFQSKKYYNKNIYFPGFLR